MTPVSILYCPAQTALPTYTSYGEGSIHENKRTRNDSETP